ncbi:MAG TPA: HAMP domain-containing sensor histidine kinase [Cyclobacteriaceae bacterium]|nr:HAMP domain-containing sensor histidine kinase [Cyclobacteriaceae bacterium]
MQIRSKLTLQFSVLVGSILLISFYFIYFFAELFNIQQFHQRLSDKAVTSAVLLLHVDAIDSALLKVIDAARRDVLYGENITIYDNRDKEIYTNNDTVFFDVNGKLLNDIRRRGKIDFRQRGYEITGLVFHEPQQDYIVIAGAIDIHGNKELQNLRTLLAILLIVMLAIVSGAGWVYAGRALKPVNNFIREVEAISVDDLHQRVKDRKYNDEIGKLIRIFNGLLKRIENAFDLQKKFVSNISHELKNPLTKITSQLEVTLLKERSSEDYRKIVESVLEDIRELNQLSSSLLDLAFLHDESKTFKMTRLRIDEMLWEAIEKVESMDPAFQIEIKEFQLPDDEEKLCLFGNPYLLKTALQNIMENACKFSPDHKAEISLSYEADQIRINIFDKGPGIGESDLEHIFQPFFRADRTSRIKGYGIGLSLSHRIISIHNGSIELESSIGHGTSAHITFKTL